MDDTRAPACHIKKSSCTEHPRGHSTLAAFTNPQNGKFMDSVNETYGPTYSLRGLFGERLLNTYDPKAMHSVLIKDAEHWPKSLAKTDNFKMFLGPGILAATEARHRTQRKMLNPMFSTAHLRDTIHIFYNVARNMQKAIASHIGEDALTTGGRRERRRGRVRARAGGD
ncbi:hypothetical protein C8Q80DRAFT_1276409 [Daedaleopsis nitida]|nr:hypothetical protein C8Q80DRAFT_1276409 [Daedaleopsis nitida]